VFENLFAESTYFSARKICENQCEPVLFFQKYKRSSPPADITFSAVRFLYSSLKALPSGWTRVKDLLKTGCWWQDAPGCRHAINMRHEVATKPPELENLNRSNVHTYIKTACEPYFRKEAEHAWPAAPAEPNLQCFQYMVCLLTQLEAFTETLAKKAAKLKASNHIFSMFELSISIQAIFDFKHYWIR